jgi:Zn-dependent peptidase ImmA (M78 family)
LPRAAFLNEFGFLAKSSRISWTKLQELKLRWKVSLGAIIRRAYDLELIDAIQYRNANIHLRKTGQAKHEIYDDVIAMEQPELLKSVLEALRKDDKEELATLPDKLHVKPGFLQKIAGDIKFEPTDFISKKLNPNVVLLRPYQT